MYKALYHILSRIEKTNATSSPVLIDSNPGEKINIFAKN